MQSYADTKLAQSDALWIYYERKEEKGRSDKTTNVQLINQHCKEHCLYQIFHRSNCLSTSS